MTHIQFGPIMLGAVTLVALGCARRDYYRPPPISGVRFYARVESNRAVDDTIRVTVSAFNRGRQTREINVGGCGHPIVIRAVSTATRRVAWDSWAWRQAEITRLNARRDTARDGRDATRPPSPRSPSRCVPCSATRFRPAGTASSPKCGETRGRPVI